MVSMVALKPESISSFETWWTIIKGQGSLTKHGLRELNYDGENHIISQNQKEVC